MRNENGHKVAKRITSNREGFGIPFYAIFDAYGKRLIDSEAPVSDIGHLSGFEGRRHATKVPNETRKNLTDAQG